MPSTVYFAKWILLPQGKILTNGGLVVSGDTITSIGTRSSLKRNVKDRIVNIGKRLLMPGLINMHTHLEEAVLRGSLINGIETFNTWMLKKNSRLKQAANKDIQSIIRLGIRESLANGTTTIVDTMRTDISPHLFHNEPVRSWFFYEISNDQEITDKELLALLQKRIDQAPSKQSIGVAPFAIFSLNPHHHKAIISYAHKQNYLWACHIAESAEELQAFSERSGDLFFHITRKKKWPYGNTQRGSMYYALNHGLITPHSILYHCNYVSSEELSLLAAKKATIVLCHQYNELFGHKSFPLEAALNRKINICLGTEAPINFNRMNLFDELFHFKRLYPHIPAENLIDWVTINAAKALQCSDYLGSIEIGKKADIIGLRFSYNPKANLLEEMLEEEPEIDFVLVNGEEVIVGL